MTPALLGLVLATAKLLVPPPQQNVADWLDTHRVIGRNYPSPFTGPWRTARTPYLRAPMNDFVDPAVEVLVLLFSSQIGKTEVQLGTLLYAYGADPGAGMFVMPTLGMAEDISKTRLVQALQTCETLRVGSQKGRTSDSSILHKRINDSPLALAGAESPATLASRPIRYLWCDEIDKWPSTTAEGDPLAQAFQRTAAFRRRKIVLTSTPTIKGASRIEDWYNRSDKRVLFAPCPRCGIPFVVEWHHVRWQAGDPSSAHLVHETPPGDLKAGVPAGCGNAPKPCPEGWESPRIEDRERGAMFAAAEWVPTAPFTGIRGYRTWAVVSPWVRLPEMVTAFLEAKKRPETLQSWVNLTRGESWEVPSQKVESAALLMRREAYAAEVPAGARVLTAGVDTQDNRLEAMCIGWGTGEEAWIISRETFLGDPSKPEVWEALDQFLTRAWPREAGGTMRIQCTLVDALGHRTADVYGAVVSRQARRVYASFGRDGGKDGLLVSAPKVLPTQQGGVITHMVDASQAKALIYSRLDATVKDAAGEGGPGVIHFPMSVGDAFFTELTSEHLITERNKYGVPTAKWAVRPGHKRNETIDCFGMALAALRVIVGDSTRFPARFETLATALDAAAGVTTKPSEGAPQPARPRAPRTQNWTPPQ